MEITVTQADSPHCSECLTILLDSVLGSYFEPVLAQSILEESCARRDLFVAIQNSAVQGFYVRAPTGMFLVFPYLHLLAVKTSLRSQGIGRQLLDHFERITIETPGYPFRPKVFLLVSDQNPDAIRFYSRQGYSAMANFANLFGEGDTEILMMKDLGLKASRY